MPPGPVPKRTSQRRRTSETEHQKATPIKIGMGAANVVQPKADPKWHKVVKDWWESLGRSGQSWWYEPSDWASAKIIAESMSRDLKPVFVGFNDKTGEPVYATLPINGARMTAYLKAWTDLCLTEGARRRARIELERPRDTDDESSGTVSWIDQARRRSS